MDILEFLRREDKYYLGGGNRVVWTPPFPVWLDRPGFWDAANFYNYVFEPCFTVTLLNQYGVEIPLRFERRDWTPARLQQRYSAPIDIQVVEEKAVLPEDSLVSVFKIKNRSASPISLQFVAWSCQRSFPDQKKEFIDNLEILNERIMFTKFLQMRNLPLYSIHCAFGMNEVPHSFEASFSETNAVHPFWAHTPFYDHFGSEGLRNEIRIGGINQNGLIFFALHRKIRIEPEEESTLWVALNMGRSDEEASEHLTKTLNSKHPIRESEESWRKYFSSVPQFRCSDPYITKYYWYRWYGLRLFTIQGGGEVNYPYSAVCEGVSYFNVPITYSAQCHMLETRWLPDPEVAHGSLLNFIFKQNPDGSFTGHIYPNGVQASGFYHANWGRGVLAVEKVHPSREFLEQSYYGLSRYVEYFDRERDREDSGLYDVVDQFETGQEFMSRYLSVDKKADTYGWTNSIRLKGVDATVYIYELKKALAQMAQKLGHQKEAEEWLEGAEKIKQAVQSLMWDPEEEMFFDVHPITMQRTGVKAAICFYPYFTDIVAERHLPGLKRHLFNPNEFWTEWPVPATSVDDPLFSPDAEWKGKRHNCPWNGRVWPMTNSHIAEALLICARRFQDRELEQRAVEFIHKFIKLLFFEDEKGEKDENRPNCFEHYHPFNGKASRYRGVDDYQHSWVVDLIIRAVAGVEVSDDGTVSLSPLNFGLEEVELTNLYVAGKRYSVRLHQGEFLLRAEGHESC